MTRTPALLAALLALAACEAPSDTRTHTVRDPATGETATVAVTEKGDAPAEITVTTKDGTGTVSMSQAGAPPAGLPAFIPVFEGADYSGSFTAAADGNRGTAGGMVSFTTTATPGEVMAFYRAALLRAGLVEKGSASIGPMTMASFEPAVAGGPAGDVASVELMASREGEGRTQAQIVWSGGS